MHAKQAPLGVTQNKPPWSHAKQAPPWSHTKQAPLESHKTSPPWSHAKQAPWSHTKQAPLGVTQNKPPPGVTQNKPPLESHKTSPPWSHTNIQNCLQDTFTKQFSMQVGPKRIYTICAQIPMNMYTMRFLFLGACNRLVSCNSTTVSVATKLCMYRHYEEHAEVTNAMSPHYLFFTSSASIIPLSSFGKCSYK